jgi:hypothetical protein
MGRARDLANILSSSGNVALDSEVALIPVTPTSITATGGSGSINANGSISFNCSTISLNGIFTSSYSNYRIILQSIPSAQSELRFRWRSSGTDNSSANYQYQNVYAASSTVTAGRGTSQTSGELLYQHGGACYLAGDILNPQVVDQYKTIISTGAVWSNTTIPNLITYHNGWNGSLLAFDGISFYASTGTIQGNIKIYGYRN